MVPHIPLTWSITIGSFRHTPSPRGERERESAKQEAIHAERERDMAARKRPPPEGATAGAATKPPPSTVAVKNSTAEPPIAPPKAGKILTTSLVFFVPYAYLIFSHYNIEPELKRSILINAALSSVAFFVTLSMIPVASRYVLRRNLFGYDINKKGTPQGSVKV